MKIVLKYTKLYGMNWLFSLWIVFIDGLLEHTSKPPCSIGDKQLLELLSKCQLIRRTLLCPLVSGWLDKSPSLSPTEYFFTSRLPMRQLIFQTLQN